MINENNLAILKIIFNRYTDRANLMPYFNIPILDVPELIIPAEDVIVMDEVYGEVCVI